MKKNSVEITSAIIEYAEQNNLDISNWDYSNWYGSDKKQIFSNIKQFIDVHIDEYGWDPNIIFNIVTNFKKYKDGDPYFYDSVVADRYIGKNYLSYLLDEIERKLNIDGNVNYMVDQMRVFGGLDFAVYYDTDYSILKEEIRNCIYVRLNFKHQSIDEIVEKIQNLTNPNIKKDVMLDLR